MRWQAGMQRDRQSGLEADCLTALAAGLVVICLLKKNSSFKPGSERQRRDFG